jgi:hypothetical protein
VTNVGFAEIDLAFRTGDLDALRTAVEDPSLIPNGWLGPAIGSCFIYAIYHSPLAFLRQLLALGGDPNLPVDDGFPPLVAALSGGRNDVLRLLLEHGADPNAQRGINDYTPLHMAVAQQNAHAILILLDHGADPHARTRIDDCETPAITGLLSGVRRRLRPGLTIIADIPGNGGPVHRQQRYRIALRIRLHRGEWIHWDHGEIEKILEVRISRTSLIPGVFYGIDGMRVGGTRRLEIAPHLAYGAPGVPGRIPANAVLTVDVTIERNLST